MKKVMIGLCLGLAAMWSFSVMAEAVGVVDMQTIFHNSPQVKKISANLQAQFKSRKSEIVAMGRKMQANLQKYQKNKSVMSASDVKKLQTTITTEEMSIRAAQAKFQQDLFKAQNKKMAALMNKIRGIVKMVAAKQKLDLVLPKNSVLYSKNDMDITVTVLKDLK